MVLFFFRQDKMVYFPPDPASINLDIVRNFTRPEVTTADGLVLKGYFIAPSPNMPVILEFHGNGSHPAWEAGKFRRLISERGFGFLLAEYRGYDGNPGSPTETKLYLDADAYLKWMRDNPVLKDHPVVLYGASIGSGIAVDLASRNADIAGLVLETPFDTLPNVAGVHYPMIPFRNYLMRNKFDNVSKIKDVKVPVLIMLAGHDGITTLKLGKVLADAANEPKTVHVFENANHINVYDYNAEEILEKFLDEKISR